MFGHMIQAFVFDSLSFVTTGTGWQIQGDHAEIWIIKLQITPFAISMIKPNVLDDVQGWRTCIDSNATVSFFLSISINTVVWCWKKKGGWCQLVGLRLGFLN